MTGAAQGVAAGFGADDGEGSILGLILTILQIVVVGIIVIGLAFYGSYICLYCGAFKQTVIYVWLVGSLGFIPHLVPGVSLQQPVSREAV